MLNKSKHMNWMMFSFRDTDGTRVEGGRANCSREMSLNLYHLGWYLTQTRLQTIAWPSWLDINNIMHEHNVWLFNCMHRCTVRVKCLAQERNTISQARARTPLAWSGEQRTKPGTLVDDSSNSIYLSHYMYEDFSLGVKKSFFVAGVA